MDGGWEANSRLDNDNGDGDGNSGQCMHCESRRGIRYITSTTESQYGMRRGFAFLLHRIEYIKASVLSSSEQMQFPRSHNAILSIATQVNWYRGAARTPPRANGAQYGLHCASRSTSAETRAEQARLPTSSHCDEASSTSKNVSDCASPQTSARNKACIP